MSFIIDIYFIKHQIRKLTVDLQVNHRKHTYKDSLLSGIYLKT